MKMFFTLLQIIFVLTSVCSHIVQERHMTLERWIKLGMNLKVNPCSNFYAFACGSWYLNRAKVGYKERFDYFLISEHSMVVQAVDILKEAVSNTDDIHLRKEKQWFNACMSTNSIVNGYYKMQKVINETREFSDSKKGGWPFVASYYAAEFSESVFFDVGLNENNMLKLDKPYLWNSELLDMQTKDMWEAVDLLYNTYFRKEQLETQQQMSKKYVINFILKIMQAIQSKREDMEIMTIQKLQQKYDSFSRSEINAKIKWIDYLQLIIHHTGRVLKLSDKIEVNLYYFELLCFLLWYSPNESVVKYIHFMTTMYKRRNWFSSPNALNLKKSRKIYYCFDGMPIQDGIIARILKKKLEEKSDWFEDLFEKLRIMHIEEIEKSWISDDLKKTAKEALKRLNFRWHGHTSMHNSDKLSYEFNITSSTLQNMINFNKAQIKYKMEMNSDHKSNQRMKRKAETPAYYNSNSNEIFVTPIVLLLPVFNISAPVSWTLGNIAFILSNEISHAVLTATFHKADSKTRFYFSSKINCFKKQFNRYKISGEDTYEESITDYQGLNVAFKLFMKISDGTISSQDKIIRGMVFTERQLFFISFATTFCESPSTGYIQGMSHPPMPMRINTALSNLKAFAETFNCPSNSMSQEEKCNLFESSESWITNLYYYLFSDG